MSTAGGSPPRKSTVVTRFCLAHSEVDWPAFRSVPTAEGTNCDVDAPATNSTLVAAPILETILTAPYAPLLGEGLEDLSRPLDVPERERGA